MKAIIKNDRKHGAVSVSEYTIPDKLEKNEVLIQVCSAAICGSDVHAYEYIPSYQSFMKVPVVLGHECSGTVVATGSEVSEFRPDDRVMGESNVYCGKCKNCRVGWTHICENNLMRGLTTDGVMREYVQFLEQNLHHLPDSISFCEGAAAQAATVSVHGVLRRFDIHAGSSVIVFGIGIIGLIAAQLARLKGAARVIIVGTNADEETRMPIARKIGFHTINCEQHDLAYELKTEYGTDKTDHAIECSGARGALLNAARCVKKGGDILLLGLPGQEIPFPFADIIRAEINIKTAYTSTWQDYEDTLSLMASGKIIIAPLLKEYYLDECEKAFEEAISKKVLKPVFNFARQS